MTYTNNCELFKTLPIISRTTYVFDLWRSYSQRKCWDLNAGYSRWAPGDLVRWVIIPDSHWRYLSTFFRLFKFVFWISRWMMGLVPKLWTTDKAVEHTSLTGAPPRHADKEESTFSCFEGPQGCSTLQLTRPSAGRRRQVLSTQLSRELVDLHTDGYF